VLEANQACALLLEHVLELTLRHFFAQSIRTLARRAANGGKRQYACDRDGHLRRRFDHDHAIRRLTQRTLDCDHQAIEYSLGVREHRFLGVTPGEAACDDEQYSGR